jgi:hypothetical protein
MKWQRPESSKGRSSGRLAVSLLAPNREILSQWWTAQTAFRTDACAALARAADHPYR